MAFFNHDPRMASELAEFDVDLKNAIRYICEDQLKHQPVDANNKNAQGFVKKPVVFNNTLVRKVFDFELTIKKTWPQYVAERVFR
jgi:hypothetical protein